jgi:hypothetical protein
MDFLSFKGELKDLDTKEKAMEQLIRTVSLRNRMGGALYFNVLNAEACMIAERCIELGIDRTVIEATLGAGNFIRI